MKAEPVLTPTTEAEEEEEEEDAEEADAETETPNFWLDDSSSDEEAIVDLTSPTSEVAQVSFYLSISCFIFHISYFIYHIFYS